MVMKKSGITEFALPSGEKVTLIYGAQHPGRGTHYLQGIRVGAIGDNSSLAKEYRGLLPIFTQELADLARQEVPSFDAIVSPPSGRSDAAPYRSAILNGQKTTDLTKAFTRQDKFKALKGNTTVDDMVTEFVYTPTGNEAEIKSLLVVDESISTGKTVAAVLHHLRKAALPDGCKIWTAVWAKLK